MNQPEAQASGPPRVATSEGLPPEFFGNVVKEMHKHWVDAAAASRGIPTNSVRRAIVLLNGHDAEVRLGVEVRAAVYVGNDRIVDLDTAASLPAEERRIRGVVPDVHPNDRYMFFDLDLGYLSFDLQPRRDMARRHVTIAEQFLHAAGELLALGGLNAACENLFAAAELATMAAMEASTDPGFGHRRRSEWLSSNGAGLGLNAEQSVILGLLLDARNSYRYGDLGASVMTPVDLVESVALVEAVVLAAQALVEQATVDETSA